MLGPVEFGWAITRAIAADRTKWLLWCGAFIGVTFLAQQAFLVAPRFGLANPVAGPPRPAGRIWQLVDALGAMLVAGGWRVADAMERWRRLR